MTKTMALTAALAASLLAAVPAQAGQYASALGKCLYTNATGADRNTLIQWAFVSLGRTSAARQVTAVPQAKADEISGKAKSLITRLTTTSCRKESTQLLAKEPGGMRQAVSSLVSEMVTDQIKGQAASLVSGSSSMPAGASLKEGRKALKGLLGR